MNLLLPTAYLPSILWCSAFWNAGAVAIATGENYQKGTLRNRAYLAGPNGVQRISIPLMKGKHQQMPIREVRIAYHEPWQRQHWRTIKTAYGNAPYFEHYAEEVRRFYEVKYEFLFDYNLDFLKFILVDKMGWSNPAQHGEAIEGDADLAEWVTFPAARHPLVTYPQVFEDKHGFIPNLSVLDLLFCCGKQGGEILKKSFDPVA